MSPKVVFATEDITSLRALEPIADEIESKASVEFLLLDDLFRSEQREVNIPRSNIDFPLRNVSNYVQRGIFSSIPKSTVDRVAHRVILDNISPQIGFEVDGYLRDADPDYFISAVDQAPFLRHIIAEAETRDITTATIQQGIYEYALDIGKIQERPLFPNLTHSTPVVEKVKRRLGFRYGVTEYTHPYSDYVFTFGGFFTQRIRRLREEYPCFGKTDVVTAGSTEFDLGMNPFDEHVDSILFLSQQQYEGGVWDWESQQQLVDILQKIGSNHQLVVRPHPKGGHKKISYFSKFFPISEHNDLATDVSEHDMVLTVNSTAMFEALLQGKVCGILQLPWYDVEFDPFTDEHILRVGPETDIDKQAKKRSMKTQRIYLNRFCYQPAIDDQSDFELTVDVIVSELFPDL